MNNQRLENISIWWSELRYTSAQRRALLILAAISIAATAFFVMRGSSEEISSAPLTLDMPSTSTQIMVDVSGAVTRPGVYSLNPNTRVVDAITAAGGLAKGADTSDINQARMLKDGEQIYIYSAAKARALSRPTVRRNGPILINRATAKEFESLDGVGPVLANRIVTYRKEHGPFTTIDDLLKVSGIGPNKFAQFKEKLRV